MDEQAERDLLLEIIGGRMTRYSSPQLITLGDLRLMRIVGGLVGKDSSAIKASQIVDEIMNDEELTRDLIQIGHHQEDICGLFLQHTANYIRRHFLGTEKKEANE